MSTNKKEDTISLCQRLIQINTSNPPGNELEAAKFCKSILDSIGFDTQLLQHSDKRASLVAMLEGQSTAETYLFVGHLDTVPAGDNSNWNHDPFGGECTQEKIFGRGASDMKGGLTALLQAAASLKSKKVKNTIILTLTADEESGCAGANAIIQIPQVRKSRFALIPEPTSNNIGVAEKGALWARITTKGKSAHGSMPDMGINAIDSMVQFINTMDFCQYEKAEHQYLGKFTSSLNTIFGGIKTNIIPDYCEITMDIRTLPSQEHQEILGLIQKNIETRKSISENFECSMETVINKPGIEVDPRQGKAADIIKIIKGAKKDSQFIGLNYYTDGAVIIPELDIPFLIFGPGDAAQAHTQNEELDLEKLFLSCEIYQEILNFLAFE